MMDRRAQQGTDRRANRRMPEPDSSAEAPQRICIVILIPILILIPIPTVSAR